MKARALLILLLVVCCISNLSRCQGNPFGDDPSEEDLELLDSFYEYEDGEDPEDEFHADPTIQTAFPYNFVLHEDYADEFIQVERSKGFIIEVPVWAPPKKFETEQEAEEEFDEFVSDYTKTVKNPERRKQWYLLFSSEYQKYFEVEEYGFKTKRDRDQDVPDEEIEDDFAGDFIWDITIKQVGLYDLFFIYCHQEEIHLHKKQFMTEGDVEGVRYRKATIHVIVDENEQYFDFIEDDGEEYSGDVEDEGFEDDDKPSQEDEDDEGPQEDEEQEREEDIEQFYRYREGDINELLESEAKLWEKNLKSLDDEPEEEEEEEDLPDASAEKYDEEEFDDENEEDDTEDPIEEPEKSIEEEGLQHEEGDEEHDSENEDPVEEDDETVEEPEESEETVEQETTKDDL